MQTSDDSPFWSVSEASFAVHTFSHEKNITFSDCTVTRSVFPGMM